MEQEGSVTWTEDAFQAIHRELCVNILELEQTPLQSTAFRTHSLSTWLAWSHRCNSPPLLLKHFPWLKGQSFLSGWNGSIWRLIMSTYEFLIEIPGSLEILGKYSFPPISKHARVYHSGHAISSDKGAVALFSALPLAHTPWEYREVGAGQ